MAKGGVPPVLDLSDSLERERVLGLLRVLQTDPPANERAFTIHLRHHPRADGSFYAKSQLLHAYHTLTAEGALQSNAALEQQLLGRPVRTISGVAPVAVLTAPHPCPGECLFCPSQEAAPKSYLDGEPGVLRAIQNHYDAYAQTHTRILSLEAIGHPTDKVELLILGGTWSAYPEEYRTAFLRDCFAALNESPDATLAAALLRNETAPHRNVGLVIETRPDWVTPEEVRRLREQGVTKVQLGVQSCDPVLLALNRRGHTLEQTHTAMRRLRLAGFKLVVHWMPNLYGATPDSDLADFRRLWDDPALRPDELKIYPTALLEGTDLHTLWKQGKYTPYSEEALVELLIRCKQMTPPYCRINRLMRDIPAQYIVAGVTKSNLRQVVQREMAARGLACGCIRCREVRGAAEAQGDAHLEAYTYATDATEEHFIQMLTPEDKLAGFLRLSLPLKARAEDEVPLPEIRAAAMIREVHVYGPAQALGQRERGAQHRGLGTQLLDAATEIARAAGFRELAVIAAVGTRPYYRERGFTAGELYPIRAL